MTVCSLVISPFQTLDNLLDIRYCGKHHTLLSLMAFSFKFLISCRSQLYEKVSQGFFAH